MLPSASHHKGNEHAIGALMDSHWTPLDVLIDKLEKNLWIYRGWVLTGILVI